jgi:LmbE family N-acetylglucosaminyl deacetylase
MREMELGVRWWSWQLGFRHVETLDGTQGSLSLEEPALAERLRATILRTQPRQIFCPFVADHHRDHAATALAVASAVEQSDWRGEVWCYEVWSPLWPNIAVDISDVVELKRRAIETYASQVSGLHYPDGILGLNRYRALRVDVSYAEAFFVSGHKEFLSLSRNMNEI